MIATQPPIVAAEFGGIFAPELLKIAEPFLVGEDELFMSANREPVDGDYSRSFTYSCYDSDEGEVRIRYEDIHQQPPSTWDKETSFDVVVATGSDSWDLTMTQKAINAAIALHRHLGHDKPFGPYSER